MTEVTGRLATPDIVLLIVILVSALFGVWRGLLKELISLVAWVAAFVVALLLAPGVAGLLSETFAGTPPAAETVTDVLLGAETQRTDDTLLLVAAFVIVFVATLVVAAFAQWTVARLINVTGLSGTDRFLGLVFGMLRGALVCIVALIALRPFAADTQWWEASQLRPELLAFEGQVLELFGYAQDALTRLPGLGDAAPGQ